MQFGDATVYMNFALKMAQQSNPIAGLVEWAMGIVYQISTYRSNAKLNRYRKSMYAQQLEKMENYLVQGSVYQYTGTKFNKKY